MARILEQQGRRIYVETKYGEPAVARLKDLGATWDRERKAWWIGSAKRVQVEAIVAAAAGTGNGSEAADGQPAKEDPDSIRLAGKAKYKGRTYFVRWYGQTKSGAYKARLITLDGSQDFWATCARPDETQHDGGGDVAVIVKTYQPREVREGFYGRGRTRTVYTTLGSIRKYIEQQKNPETRRGECTECGALGPSGEPCKECGGEGSHV